MDEQNRLSPLDIAYLARIEKFRQGMSKLSKLIEHEPPQEEIRRLLNRPDEEDSSEEEVDLLENGQLQRDLEELKGLSVQRSLLDSSAHLKQYTAHGNKEGTAAGDGSASYKNLTGQEETTTFVHKLESEVTLGAAEQDHLPQLLKPIGREDTITPEQQATNSDGKPHIRKKSSNKKPLKVDAPIQRGTKQHQLPKSPSNSSLKRSNNTQNISKGNRSKPLFETYNSVPTGLVFERSPLQHQLSPKINARKVQARRTIQPPVEQSNELRKKLHLNLSQARTTLQRLVDQKHLSRRYQQQNRRYEGLVMSVRLAELEKELERCTISSFPYRNQTLRLLCQFAAQFSRKVSHQINMGRGRCSYDTALLTSLPVLQTLTGRLCSNNILCQEKYQRFTTGTDALWASLNETRSMEKVQLLKPFQLLQALKHYLQFLIGNQLVQLTVRRNLFTKRKVCGYYSHRSHRQRSRNDNNRKLDRSYKNEGRTLQAAKSQKKLDRPEWQLKEFRRQLMGKFKSPQHNNQLSTRSKQHISPISPKGMFAAISTKTIPVKPCKARRAPA